MNIATALKQAKQQLSISASPRLDAEVLLCSVLQCDRSKLYAAAEQLLSKPARCAFDALILLRKKGHPIAHLINKKEFWSMDLMITTDTLIPRPETEILVETILALLPIESSASILELGTGSGAISLAIAKERPTVNITATDISKPALYVAKANAKLHQLTNIVFKYANWLVAEHSTYDFIISNPPYIVINDPHLEYGDVAFEARSALIAGKDGLDDLRIIINSAPKFLNDSGWLLLEHGFEQGVAVRELLVSHHFYAVKTIPDYHGLERVSLGQLKYTDANKS